MDMKHRVNLFGRPATSVSHSKEVVKIVDRVSFVKLNKSLEPKLKSNKEERQASMKSAHNFVVR